MYDDQMGSPDPNTPQGKLILPGYSPQNAPAYPQENTIYSPQQGGDQTMGNAPTYYPSTPGHPPFQAPYTPLPPHSQQLPQSSLPQQGVPPYGIPPYGGGGPQGPRKRLDPVYKLLIIAVAVVLLSGITFTAFASGILGQVFSPHSTTGNGQANAGTPAPAPVQNTQGNSVTPNAQPTQPLPSPTPVLTPTPAGQFSLQFTNIPLQVTNNTTEQVSVTASQPAVRVRLSVTYNVAPFTYHSQQKRADDNGRVQLNWHVRVFPSNANAGNITANVTAISFDDNGHQIKSSTVQVPVMTGGTDDRE